MPTWGDKERPVRGDIAGAQGKLTGNSSSQEKVGHKGCYETEKLGMLR